MNSYRSQPRISRATIGCLAPFTSLMAALALAICLPASGAADEPGPGLRPPGLAPDLPLDDPGSAADEDDEKEETVGSQWELNADSVVYSAAKKRQLVAEAPSTIHVITDQQIERYGWRSLSDTLRMVPGVQTRTWLAQYQSVMIRGLLGTEVNNTRILWLEDGVPFNDTRDGGVWMDITYPVELIKRIEVVLGPGSALYGTGAFQGVINVFTKDPGDIPETGEYRAGFGAFNTLRSAATYGYQDGEYGFLIFGSANYTTGPGLISDFRYRQRQREAGAEAVRDGVSPLDPAYDPQPVPSNSDRNWQNVTLKGLLGPVRITGTYRRSQAGFDGAEFFPTERYRFNRDLAGIDVVYDDSFSDSVGFVALASYRFFRNEYVDYFDLDLDSVVQIQQFDEVINDPRYPDRLDEKVSYQTDQHKVFTLTQVSWQIFESNELIAGVGGRFEAISAPEFRTGQTSQEFVNGSAFVQDEQKLFDDDLILTAGARIDTHREFGPQFSFRGAVLYKWTDWLLSRLSYGTAFREPSMSQLYIDHFNAVGNPNLDAETLQNVELSTVAKPIEALTLRLDAFVTLMDNLILNDFDESRAVPFLGIDGKFVSQQENAARIIGAELSAKADFDHGFSFFAHYNFLDSRSADCSSCEFELNDYDAPHRVGSGLAWENEFAVTSLMLQYVDSTKDSAPTVPGEERDDAQAEEVPFYVTVQPYAAVRLPGDMGVSVEANWALSEGLSDSPFSGYYYETLGVPVPRFTFFASIMYPFIR